MSHKVVSFQKLFLSWRNLFGNLDRLSTVVEHMCHLIGDICDNIIIIYNKCSVKEVNVVKNFILCFQ